MVTVVWTLFSVFVAVYLYFCYRMLTKRRTFLDILRGFSTNEMDEEEVESFSDMRISIKRGVMCKECGAVVHPRAKSTHAGYHSDMNALYGAFGATPDMVHMEDRAKAMAVEILKEMHRGERTRST